MDVRELIERTKPPAFVANLRQQPMKAQAHNIRQLFRTLGIKGVSVTMRFSSIRVKLPERESKMVCCETTHARFQCPDCRRLFSVHEKLSNIILGAFPDLDDRSDMMSDYFDYCFYIID